MTKILAVIPVKMNSKRLKKKNTKNLCGHPMFIWTYAAAIKCKYLSKVIISSESKKILKIARNYGYKEKYIRPKNLTKDKFTNSDVAEDVIKNQSKLGYNYNHIILLQPTSPIKKKKMLSDFIKSYLKSKCHSGLSLKGPKFKKYDFLGKLKNDKYVKLKKGLDYKKLYSPNASIYISNVKKFLRNKKFFSKSMFGYVHDKFQSIDVDHKEDFQISELILSKKLIVVEIPKKLK